MLVSVLALAAARSDRAGADPLSFQPTLGMPASDVAVIGASPEESAGETWAQGQLGAVPAFAGEQTLHDTQTLLRYTSASGTWQVVPVDNAQGESLNFKWWASEVTAHGGVVLAGSTELGHQGLVVRDPGGAFANVPAPSSSGAGAVIASGEQLFAGAAHTGAGPDAPVMAALDEADGDTGALVVPVAAEAPPAEGSKSEGESTSFDPGVLHYDGTAWSREPICERYETETCTAPGSALTAIALSASSAGNAWLLASTDSTPLVLFQRIQGAKGNWVWVRRQPASWLFGSGPAPVGGESTTALKEGPSLTAVGQGVWVDAGLTASAGTGDATVLVSPGASGEVAGTWCYPTSLCPGDASLGAELSGDYASFAWAGPSPDDPGTRIITGLSEGALLVLGQGQPGFSYMVGGGTGGADGAVGPGGEAIGQLPDSGSTPRGGAAFSSPEEGWLGTASSPAVIHVTSVPSADGLASWPVPFRRPLLAIAAQPGTTPGEATAQALAVGADGEVARYVPGEGWTPEYLYNSTGERQTPNLRGVAWPEAGRAYAVGDEGAMWLWQASTDLWSPDPAEPPGFDGQLTAIAFSPTNPDLGYAVGKQGVLLSYNKTWSQEAPPAGLSQADFTSVAFAGDEAIATYRTLSPTEAGRETGGLIVNEGSGWKVDPSAQALLSRLPPDDTVLSKAAGLTDGGAVAAGPGVVIERDSAAGPWHFSSQPLPEAENVSALAAIREGSSVRALVSLDTTDPYDSIINEEIENPPGAVPGSYGVLLGPEPLPDQGFLLRETAGGWQDVEHNAYPQLNDSEDLPGWPDAVLALSLNPSGESGWAVGGQTGAELAAYGSPGAQEAAQTAGVMRYGPGPAPPQVTNAPISIPHNEVTFAVGGDAQCNSPCSDLANDDIGPDAWLSGAISRADQIAGLRAFLYTGTRLAANDSRPMFGADAFNRELSRYASLLTGNGTLPTFTTASPSDVPAGGTTAAFSEAMGDLAPAGSAPSGTPAPPAGTAAYALDSNGPDGTVRLIVLDYSQSQLSPKDTNEAPCPSDWSAPANQLQWLCAQLYYARQDGVPAIVMGSANISEPSATNYARDGQNVSQVLLEQGASAYLFDSPEENVSETIGTGSDAIPAYGSGTLGYVAPGLNDPEDFLGASGFLLVSVNAAERNTSTGVAPVTAELIPSVGQLGLNAIDGTLLRRSQVALFEGLARRPVGGEGRVINSSGDTVEEAPDPYTAIPQTCVGSNCARFIQISSNFTSSNPEIGDFVEQNPNSITPEVLQVHGKPVPDSASGLFCAYNAGTTIVTITAGGLSYSEPVTVQAGSAEEPCGTVPVATTPASEESQSAPALSRITPEGSPTPTEPFPSFAAPPAPQTPAPFPAAPAASVVPLLPQPATPTPPRAALPPPFPQPARPTPPSGSSEVSQTVAAAEREREEKGAIDMVHNAAAYEPGGEGLPPWSPIPLLVIAAAAGAQLRRRRPRRAPAAAHARSVSHISRRRP